MEDRFPSTAEVRHAHPGELAVLLSTVTSDAVSDLSVEEAEAVVVATQRVASWSHALQAVAVDRFAEHVLEAQEVHAAELMAARDAQREAVEASGGTWRGGSGAVALPEPEQIAASMLAPELRISPRTMRTRLARARALMELPRTLGLALTGELEPWRVDGVVAGARDVAAERLVELEARLYATDVTDLPKPRLVERVRRAAAKADPDGVARGVECSRRRRSLRVSPSETTGLMRWSLEVPDELSRRMFAAVDDLAQEYLTADRATAARQVSGSGADGTAGAGSGPGGGRRTVEAARLDALGDLVMANAQVETVVELVVPVGVGSGSTTVTRATRRAAAGDELARARRPRPVVPPPSVGASTDPTPSAGASTDPTPSAGASTDPTPSAGASTDPPPTVDMTSDDVGEISETAVDLVLGAVTRDTLAAGQVERRLGLLLGAWLEVGGNPFLADRPPPGRPSSPTRVHPPSHDDETVWFVDGIVEAPGATTLLPEHVVELLRDPDTRLRVRTSDPGSVDGRAGRRRTYRPGRALARRVRERDRHCRFPGCSVAAARCHLDHVVPHPAGDTVEGNLQALCPAHHGFKHHAGWTVTMARDGTCSWTSPTGRTHVTTPAATRDLAA